MLRKLMIVFTAAMAIGIATFPTNASAQWRGGGWHGGGWYGGGWGWGLGAGLLGGAIIGSALAAPHYYYYPNPYYAAPGYYGPPSADATAYCMQQFKSYDPRSGTYLGYDGYRHPCP
jgi:hypothetical protein